MALCDCSVATSSITSSAWSNSEDSRRKWKRVRRRRSINRKSIVVKHRPVLDRFSSRAPNHGRCADVIFTYLLLSNATGLCLLPQVCASYHGTVSQSSSCVIKGHLQTDRNWYGYLANITVVGVARLTFELVYPMEKCCQNILFYRQEQAVILGARMNCWQKEYLLRPEDDQILRLTPSFSWSGCHTASSNSLHGAESFHDIANYRDRAAGGLQGRRVGSSSAGSDPGGGPPVPDLYVCKGGRSFTVDESLRDPVTWYIAVSNCATLHGLDLSYVLEIHGQVGDCPQLQQHSEPFIDVGGAGTGRPTANTRGRQPSIDLAAAAVTVSPGKALLTAREASVVVQQQGADGSGTVAHTSGDGDDVATGHQSPVPCVLEGNVNTSMNWFGFFANLTLRGSHDDGYLDGDDDVTGSMDNEPGWFRFTFTYPYDMMTQDVILYDPDDLPKLHWEQVCSDKMYVIPSRLVSEKILDLGTRSTYNGCKTQTVLYNDEPINLTCTGEKRFDSSSNSMVDGYRQQQQQQQPSRRRSSTSSLAVEPTPRRIFMALSNCRSSVGLLLHYRLEIFGNVDPNMCSNAAGLSVRFLSRQLTALSSSQVIVAALVVLVVDPFGRRRFASVVSSMRGWWGYDIHSKQCTR